MTIFSHQVFLFSKICLLLNDDLKILIGSISIYKQSHGVSEFKSKMILYVDVSLKIYIVASFALHYLHT